MDISQIEYYKIFSFMKTRGFSLFELDSLSPFELEIYYYMNIKEYKQEKGIK